MGILELFTYPKKEIVEVGQHSLQHYLMVIK